MLTDAERMVFSLALIRALCGERDDIPCLPQQVSRREDNNPPTLALLCEEQTVYIRQLGQLMPTNALP